MRIDGTTVSAWKVTVRMLVCLLFLGLLYLGCLGPMAYFNDGVARGGIIWRSVDVVFAPAYYVRDQGPDPFRAVLWNYISLWDPYEEGEVLLRMKRHPNRMMPGNM